MICPNCHTQNASGARFCIHCGTPLPQGGGQPPQPQYQPPQYYNPYQANPQPQKLPAVSGGVKTAAKLAGAAAHKKLIIGIIIAVVAVVTVTVAVPQVVRPKPEETITKLEKAMNALDYDTAMECFDDQAQNFSDSTMKGATSLIEGATGLKNLSDTMKGLSGLLAASGMSPKVSITVNDIQYYDKDHCVANITMTTDFDGSVYEDLAGEDMESQTEKTELPMVYDSGDKAWKITMDTSFTK